MASLAQTTQDTADSRALHMEQVAALLHQHGIPAEYDEKYAADEDLYRIAMFKALPCPKNTQHDWACCPYAHVNERARRRSLMIHTYYTKVCPDMQNRGECPHGENCTMTHSMFEYWMHPQRYRTKLCREGPKCTRPYCFFAHSQEQLRDGSDEPAGLQLLQAFTPCRTACIGNGDSCYMPTPFAANGSLSGAQLPPLPAVAHQRSAPGGRLGCTTQLQQQPAQQQLQRQLVLAPGGNAMNTLLLPAGSACSSNQHSSPVASSSSNCSSSSSIVQSQAGQVSHGMSLLGAGSVSVSPAGSGNWLRMPNGLQQQAPASSMPVQLAYQQQQQQQLTLQQAGQLAYTPNDALALQLQQLQLGQDQALPGVAEVLMLRQAQTTVLPAATATVCMPGLQLSQTTAAQEQQQQQHFMQQPLQLLTPSQQQQLVLQQTHLIQQPQQLLQPAATPDLLQSSSSGPAALALQGSMQLPSWCQGFDLLSECGRAPKQMLLQRWPDEVWQIATVAAKGMPSQLMPV